MIPVELRVRSDSTRVFDAQAAPTEENLESLENLLGNIAAIAPGECR